MAKILKHPRVYSFLHVPVQAGADSVLHAMRREYTNAEFCRVVDYLLEHVPDMTIATDVICGWAVTFSSQSSPQLMAMAPTGFRQRRPKISKRRYSWSRSTGSYLAPAAAEVG